MLGKTNLLFVAEDEPTDLSFTPQYILTPASGSIIKLEMINNLIFAFTSDEKVYYGSDINNLQLMKKSDAFMPAKHIIYADGVYYMTNIESTKGKAIIYKTSDFSTYEELTLKTGNSSYTYPVHGLFLKSTGEIVVLIEEKISDNSTEKYLLIVETLTGYDEQNADFISIGKGQYIYQKNACYTTMKKDRIFTEFYKGTSSGTYGKIITLDGTVSTCDKYTHFASDYFFRFADNMSRKTLYYSLNGIDYIYLNFTNAVENFDAIELFEYDGNIALIYNGNGGTKIALAATPSGLIEAISTAIPVKYDYTPHQNSNLYNDEYVYLGCTGGIIIKAKIDYSDITRPDISLLKTLSARQALTAANEYTERLFAELETRVEALEKAAN